MRIPFEQMLDKFRSILIRKGFDDEERALLCARMFAEASRDGVYTHGLNRFPIFIHNINRGLVDVNARPILRDRLGIVERYDGQAGPGNLNAHFAMGHAIELARKHGIGCVVMRNTNHWMRAGNYGWQAAEAGCIGICWTNSFPHVPPWGSKEPKLGNNPIVFAVPREKGPVVLDIALSQFSWGKLQIHKQSGEPLPADGGFDADGNMSRDAGAILAAKRMLPIGLWKGSGLSLLLDLIVTLLSGGNSVKDIGDLKADAMVSQIFIAIDAVRLPDYDISQEKIDAIIADLHDAQSDEHGGKVRYPGEGTMRIREQNLRDGIPVDEEIWKKVLDMDA